MTSLRRGADAALAVRDACARSAGVFLRDTGHGLLEISHNTFALVGLAVVAGTVFVAGRADLRHAVETHALGWLQERHGAAAGSIAAAPDAGVPAASEIVDPDVIHTPTLLLPAARAAIVLREGDAVSRATAADPRELTRQQAAVAHWLARRYRVAPEPISRLVKEAWHVAPRSGLDPTLILAVMAVESSFNPFAQSPVGAQGLMQVMTRVHDGKYQRFGGTLAAFDPVTNLKVGVQVLKECVARAGSIEAGLRHYVGAANLPHDGGYAGKVLAEQGRLRDVAGGKLVALNAPSAPRTAAGTPTPTPTLMPTPARRPAAIAASAPHATPTAVHNAAPAQDADVEVDSTGGAAGSSGAGAGSAAGTSAAAETRFPAAPDAPPGPADGVRIPWRVALAY